MVGTKKHKTPICKGCNRPLGKIRSKIQCSGDCKGKYCGIVKHVMIQNQIKMKTAMKKVKWKVYLLQTRTRQ